MTSEAGSAERTVMVTAGSTASVVFSLTKVAVPIGGWLSISSPFNVEVHENNDAIGSSGASRIMLAAGRHDITLSSRALGFQDTRRIHVAAGRTAIRVRLEGVRQRERTPMGRHHAGRQRRRPDTDCESAGGDRIAPIVFRHPQLGERKETVTVSVTGPNRIAVDLTK